MRDVIGRGDLGRVASALRLLLALLPAFAAGASPPAADAPGLDPRDLAELEIEQLMALQVETTQTASKHEQTVSSAPASVTVVTAEEIRDLGYRTLADLLRGVRGLFTTYDRNYAYLGFRGFDRPGDFNTRVLLLVDGHQVNDNIFDQAFIGTDFPVDLDLAERVEIVRGPGSSLYGGNALFGVVNVITRRPAERSGAELSAEAASFGSYKGRVTYGLTHPSGVEALFSLSGYDSLGQDLHYPEFSASPSNGWANGQDWDRSGSFLGKASYQGLSLEVVGGRRDKGIPTASYGTVFGDPRNETTDSRLFAELKYERPVRPGFEVMSRVYFDEYFFVEPGAFPPDASHPTIYVNKDDNTGRWIGSEARTLATWGEALTFVVGGELKRHIQQDQKNYDVGGATYLDDRRQSTAWGLYAQAESRLGGGLQLELGARYDHYETFGGTLNPRAALIYNPWPDTTLKALYGRAFRPPTVYELYYQYPGWVAAGALNPETLHTEELVLEQRFGKAWRLTAAGYLIQAFDLITQANANPADPSSPLTFRNMTSVHAVGVEAEIEHRWPGGFAGRLSYALQRTQEDPGTTLTDSPTHLAKLQLHGPLLWQRLRGGLELLYASSRKTLAGAEAPPYLLANLTLLAAGLWDGKLDVSASIYNLLGTSYADPGSGPSVHVMDLIPQDGRSFRVKAVARF